MGPVLSMVEEEAQTMTRHVKFTPQSKARFLQAVSLSSIVSAAAALRSRGARAPLRQSK